MRKARFKFSLRLLLVLMLVASIVFWRYSVRLEIASWTSEIQDRGGRVLYVWQNPRLKRGTITGQIYPRPVLRDGKIEQELVFPPPQIPVQTLCVKWEKLPFQWADVLTGRNRDLQVECVAIAADQLDEKTISILYQMPELKMVVFPISPRPDSKRLDKLRERLPNVEFSSPFHLQMDTLPVY